MPAENSTITDTLTSQLYVYTHTHTQTHNESLPHRSVVTSTHYLYQVSVKAHPTTDRSLYRE
jgi:hypothetical protein